MTPMGTGQQAVRRGRDHTQAEDGGTARGQRGRDVARAKGGKISRPPGRQRRERSPERRRRDQGDGDVLRHLRVHKDVHCDISGGGGDVLHHLRPPGDVLGQPRVKYRKRWAAGYY